MRLTDRLEQPRARVELLPLIDVIFLLLVFFIFMMSSMTLQRGVEVKLPTADNAAIEKAQTLQITIDRDGQLFLDGQPQTAVSLLPAIIRLQQRQSRPILIQGDAEADLGIAIELLGRLNAAGFHRVAFAAERPGAQR